MVVLFCKKCYNYLDENFAGYSADQEVYSLSKIVCDICGTSYPETAKQCPICGCVRPGDVQRVTNEVKSDGKVSAGYTYVKGGRFSKNNVKKRRRTNTSRTTGRTTATRREKEPENQSGRGLVIVAILLLLAIIGVVIYIAVRFFGPASVPDVEDTKPTGTESVQLDLSCRGITLDAETVELKSINAEYLLSYKLQPENTTDKVTFRSENPEIATVNEQGNITVIAEGTAKIVIMCGEAEKAFTVVCKVEKQPTIPTIPTKPTTPPTTPTDPSNPTTPTSSQGELRLNRKDMSLFYKGDRWDLYSGSVAKNLVTWTSDDEKVVTFVDGVVVAVGGGVTNVHATFGDQKVSCIVRCNFQDNNGGSTGSGGGISEDGSGTTQPTTAPTAEPTTAPTTAPTTEPTTAPTTEPTTPATGTTEPAETEFKVYTQWGNDGSDVTINVGETVVLTLRDDKGNKVNVDWTTTATGCTVSGSSVTGVTPGEICKVSAAYQGKTYVSIVRINSEA